MKSISEGSPTIITYIDHKKVIDDQFFTCT
jgi:hypothetical protein